jgi:hypothetical protein
VYRALAFRAINALADVSATHTRFRERHHRLIDEYRRLRDEYRKVREVLMRKAIDEAA